VRGFYAAADRATPARIGLLAVGVDLVVTAALLWPLGERGLAISTAVAAGVQVVVLAVAFSRVAGPLPWRSMADTMGRGMAATAVMAATAGIVGTLITLGSAGRAPQMLTLLLTIAAGAGAYLVTARLLHMSELDVLLAWPAARRKSPSSETAATAAPEAAGQAAFRATP
jgi:putative peptidoglycan lipid II flippase